MLHKLLGLHLPLQSRDRNESHRAATSLELLYDLVVVIAIATIANGLHHAILENHIGQGVLSYAMIFWAILWAWTNFTWFASAFDTDDVYYRICVFIQLLGSLIIAAAAKKAFEENEWTLALIGYIVMRIALISLYFRVRKAASREERKAITRMIAGTLVCQIGWTLSILFTPPSWTIPAFLVLATCEHLVPFYASSQSVSNWHREHIIERYGLLTIIVLGESILALMKGIQILSTHYDPAILTTLTGGFLILATSWWIYFDEKEHPSLIYTTKSFLWGYGHYFIFAPIAALGAGLAVAFDHFSGHSEISTTVANSSVAVPLAIFLIALWFIHEINTERKFFLKSLYPLAAVLILITSYFEYGIILIAAIMVTLLVLRLNLQNAPLQTLQSES